MKKKMMSNVFVTNIDNLGELLGGVLRPTREHRLMDALDGVESFCQAKDIEFDSSEVLMMMEELTSDLSQVLDVSLAYWSVQREMNNDFDLVCQCRKATDLMDYDIIVYQYYNQKDPDTGQDELYKKPYYHVTGWSERLPEQH